MNKSRVYGFRPGALVRTPAGPGKIHNVHAGIIGREVSVKLLDGKFATFNEDWVERYK